MQMDSRSSHPRILRGRASEVSLHQPQGPPGKDFSVCRAGHIRRFSFVACVFVNKTFVFTRLGGARPLPEIRRGRGGRRATAKNADLTSKYGGEFICAETMDNGRDPLGITVILVHRSMCPTRAQSIF